MAAFWKKRPKTFLDFGLGALKLHGGWEWRTKNGAEMMKLQLTADYVGRRIEHAGAVMRCLCVKHPSTLLAQGRAMMIREALEGYVPGGDARAYPMPSPRDVSLMDEALAWILLIPNETKRRVVSLRSQYHPLHERHVMSWRACGTSLRIATTLAQATG